MGALRQNAQRDSFCGWCRCEYNKAEYADALVPGYAVDAEHIAELSTMGWQLWQFDFLLPADDNTEDVEKSHGLDPNLSQAKECCWTALE